MKGQEISDLSGQRTEKKDPVRHVLRTGGLSFFGEAVRNGKTKSEVMSGRRTNYKQEEVSNKFDT